jgi:small subunit ribosomal protein S9
MTDETTPNTDQTPPVADTAPETPAATTTPEATETPAATQATETVEAPAPTPMVALDSVKGPDPQGWWRGTGRRKAAVARIRIKPGEGKFVINNRSLDTFFTEERDRNNINDVLKKTETFGAMDIHATVHGGGYTGQAGAIILGLGRALRNYDISLDSTLRKNGYLSRDPRKVERKKPGQPGARKRFQFSKR